MPARPCASRGGLSAPAVGQGEEEKSEGAPMLSREGQLFDAAEAALFLVAGANAPRQATASLHLKSDGQLRS